MTEGNFVDYVKMFACSGNGGKGSVHLHREKLSQKAAQMVGMVVARGHIIVRGCDNLWTLHHLKFNTPF